MSDFFQKRLARHQKRMMRYMRYVFNDHFVLVCLFLLGGVGFYYSNLLKTLPDNFFWGNGIVALIWLASLYVGSFVTLAEPADMVFLLPKENEMGAYFKRSFAYSCLVPFFLLVLVSGFLMPLLVISGGFQFGEFFWFLLMLWSLKFSQLQVQRYGLYQISQTEKNTSRILWLVSAIVILFVGVYTFSWLGAILGVAQAVGVSFYFKRRLSAGLDWEAMVDKEQNRLHRLYQFINLFTDVPEITATVKRRKYLDGVLNFIPRQHKQTYLYLYARRMLRGSEFSGLYLRLVAIGSLFLYFLDSLWFSVGLGVVFLYLIGFQLIPLYNQFHYMVLTQLYPVSSGQKGRAIQSLIGLLLLVAAVIFGLFALVGLKNLQEAGISLASYLVVVLGFTKLYVPSRIKKMER
ncbi:multidrug ABC transporter permease [Enterococcus sp. JM4C]|uniref:ABC transporter permease n=1 Tax=Candidatus Enterococcus huntleyi TaxID=1857217 RepID=UPI001379FEA3|nr:ABC transporter permease [Enterococcus sp. JM4C]KAF1299083.1 multidrug ABC transporter permease [Enterococcus sp. JM4C]